MRVHVLFASLEQKEHFKSLRKLLTSASTTMKYLNNKKLSISIHDCSVVREYAQVVSTTLSMVYYLLRRNPSLLLVNRCSRNRIKLQHSKLRHCCDNRRVPIETGLVIISSFSSWLHQNSARGIGTTSTRNQECTAIKSVPSVSGAGDIVR